MSQNDPQNVSAQKADSIKKDDNFLGSLPRSQFPTAQPTTAEAKPVDVSRSNKNFSRVVLPAILFVIAVGGVAFLIQNLPSARVQPKNKTVVASSESKDLIAFALNQVKMPNVMQPVTLAIWDSKDETYSLELEQGTKGYYDFYFENVADYDVEMGLVYTSCDCAAVKASLLEKEAAVAHVGNNKEYYAKGELPPESSEKFEWVELATDGGEGIVVPKGKSGILRLSWKGRRQQGEHLRLKITVWTQPHGSSSQTERSMQDLNTLVVMTSPANFYPQLVDFGVLVPGANKQESIWCWSATRKDVEVEIEKSSTNECVQFSVHRLDEKEKAALQQKLRQSGINTRVLVAQKIVMDVAEQRGKDQLEMGRFVRSLPVKVTSGGEVLETQTPQIRGWVRSEVRVLGSAERDEIQLGSFKKSQGKTVNVILVTDDKTKLELKDCYPVFLRTKLSQKEKVSGEIRWNLEVTVPPNEQEGYMPDDSVILLEATRPDGSSRRARIPVKGTAVRD